MQTNSSEITNPRQMLVDVYKKLNVISQDLDSMAQDPKERRMKRYSKMLSSYDMLAKRAHDLQELVDKSPGAEEASNRMRDILALVEWARKRGEKQNLMKFKILPPGEKTTLILRKDASRSKEREFEDILEKRMRVIFGKSLVDEIKKKRV